MSAMAGESPALHFSTENLPEQHRVAAWKETLRRKALYVEVDPLPQSTFHVDVKLRALPGLGMMWGTLCGIRHRRTRELVADGNDRLILVLNLAGPLALSWCGREMLFGQGDAHLMSCVEITTYSRPASGRVVEIWLPRPALAALVTNVDGAVGRLVPRNTAALTLLASYVEALGDRWELSSPEIRHLFVAHIYDLVALIVSATRDAAAVPGARSVRAARLSAIKADITRHLVQGDVSVSAVAAHQHVTPRYVQMLFKAEGTTFTKFVLGLRLARVHRALTDLRLADRNISTIVFASGFGDLSYFNRAFRRLYGASPSQVRAAGRREEVT
jgi:AraC-like DNA-binding protein